MTSEQPVIYVVDDDAAVRDSIQLLMQSVGLVSAGFENAQEFLAGFDPNALCCILLDIRMPGMSGLQLQKELQSQGCCQPIIFITGHGDVPMAVQAMRDGAADFIQKPFRDQDLIDRIQEVLDQAGTVRDAARDLVELRRCFEQLTDREVMVFDLVATGHVNKQIAFELGVSTRTVELHRANVIEKLGAKNVSQLVRQHIALERST